VGLGPRRTERDDVGDRRLAEEDRHLPEEVATGQARPLRPVNDDRGLAVEDDVEPRPADALPQDAFALGEDGLVERVDDPLELRRGQVGEQPEARDRVDELLAIGHARIPSAAWGRRPVSVDSIVPRPVVPARGRDAV
jgi:hypothetical protein